MRSSMSLAVTVVMLAGCSGSFDQGVRRAGYAALAASTIALACDGIQTMNRPPGIREMNPVLGRDPSNTAVIGYSLTAIVVNAAAWWLTPRDSKPVVPTAVFIGEMWVVTENTIMGASPCGL